MSVEPWFEEVVAHSVAGLGGVRPRPAPLFDSDSEDEAAWEERRRVVNAAVAAERGEQVPPIPTQLPADEGNALGPVHTWSTAYQAFASSDDAERYLRGNDRQESEEEPDDRMEVDPPEIEVEEEEQVDPNVESPRGEGESSTSPEPARRHASVEVVVATRAEVREIDRAVGPASRGEDVSAKPFFK